MPTIWPAQLYQLRGGWAAAALQATLVFYPAIAA